MNLNTLQFKSNWPLLTGFAVWLIALVFTGANFKLYLILSAVAVALFTCQVVLHFIRKRAKHGL